MEDAFTIEEKNIHKVKGKTVVLVDDIYTTGATLDMCSRVLKEAGADKIYVLTFAAGSMMVNKT
jgi:predicted amidophosphoribosyltransferase